MFERLRGRRAASGAAPSSTPAGATAGKRWGWPAKVLLGIAIFLVLFALIGFFAVPPIAKHYLVKELSEQLGRPVSIEDIDVNPFAMRAIVKGFKVMEPAGEPVFVSFDEFLVNAEYRSILRLAPVLKQIRITNPYLHIVRNADGTTYNFSDLIDKFAKQPDTAPPEEEKPREAKFSLNNIELVGGKVEFDDRPKQARHVVDAIDIAIPFISNLPDRVEEYIQPAFSARVNGAPVSLTGQTKPFKDTLETAVDVNIDGLDLPRYVEYVPVRLGFKLPSGTLDTRLTVSFVQQPSEPRVLIKGNLTLQKLAMTEPGGAPLFNLGSLTVPIESIDVFAARYAFGKIAIAAPEVFVQRAQDGSVNWVRVQPLVGDGTPSEEGPEIALTVGEVAIANGIVHVEDQVPEKDFRTDLADISATLRGLTLPQEAPAQLDLALTTDRKTTVALAASLLIEPLTAEGKLDVGKIGLTDYETYYAPFILYRLEDGQADLSTQFAFRMAESGPETRLSAFNLDLRNVRMIKPGVKENFLRARSAQIKDAEIDVNKLILTVGEFVTRDGLLDIVREPDGALNVTRVLPAPPEKNQPAQEGTPWQITLNKAVVDKWQIAFTDLAIAEPVKVVADDVRLRANGVSNQPNKTGRIDLQAKLNEGGSVKAAGTVSLAPVKADLDVDLRAFGLVPLQPYFTEKVNILLSSADASVKGKASLALDASGKPSATFKGEANLTDFASIEKSSSEDLLKWQSLFVGGIDYTLEPMALSIEEIALSNFFARIIIFPDGHLNLQDIVVKEGDGVPPVAPESDEEGAAVTTAAAGGDARPKTAAQQTAQASPTPGRDSRPGTDGNAAPAPPPEQPTAMPPIRIARVTLQGGDVNFTDLFVKPNYSASLSEIGGSVLGLSSELNTTADVDLRGRFAKTAPVEIKGRINPLVENLFLDIGAKVRDIELGPFTPYSGKYVGYAIEKGKMRFDVEYKVENRKLSAQNRLVLDQLTFGEKVESPDAIKAPVLLAVALLKDRNGVIDVNLPISGSLDDPKFSIGGIVIRIIFNLITKAVTAPFALIGNLLGGEGGGEELAYIEFDDGVFALSQTGQDKAAKLQTALIDRPGLKLDITGRADPVQDREALRQIRFDQQVKAQKLKDLVRRGESVKSVDEVEIAPEEYEKYLKRAYKEAKFAKPRNAIGLVKSLPKEEMEKLMLANLQITDDDLNQLAIQRAQAAKDAITRDGKVELERVFLLAPKVEAGKADDKLGPSRVDFSLK